MTNFELGRGCTTKRDIYDFANILYEKVKALRKKLEGPEKTEAREIETSLDVLRKHLKREV